MATIARATTVALQHGAYRMSLEAVWMTAKTAAAYLDMDGKDPAEAFRVWAKRHGVPTARRGSRVLYHRDDILRAIGAGHRKFALVG